MPSESIASQQVFDESAKINQEQFMPCFMAVLYEKRQCNGDVIFNVDGKHFKAHRNILAAQTPVFETMLLEAAYKEANSEIVNLPNKNAASFEVFLNYLYTFTIELGQLRLDTIIDVIHLANEYQVNQLVIGLAEALESVVNDESVFQIFECAHLLCLDNLLDTCREFLFENAARVVKNAELFELSKTALVDLISSDLFCAPEIDILLAVEGWHKRHPDLSVKDVLSHIRFPYVSLDGVKLSRVAPLCKLLADNAIDLDLACEEAAFSAPRKIIDCATENVATIDRGAVVEDLSARQMDFFFGTSKTNWLGYLAYNAPLIVKLAKPSRINTMSFDIYGGGSEDCPCFLKIETSQDKTRWRLLVDCQRHACNRQQLVMFRPRNFQYIRLTVFPVPGYDSDDYAIESFHCPAIAVAPQECSLIAQQRQTGKTLIYQGKNRSTNVFD